MQGNEGRLLIDGPATHRAMFEAIGRARDHINLQTYILEAEGPGERLAELLIRKRRQGVTVNVLYDSVGSMKTPKEFFERLRAAGIAVCEFNPVNPLKSPPRGWQINNRDHRKILVVDGRVAFTGGINISGVYSAGSFGSRRTAPSRDEGWRDTHVATRGPIVASFQRVFLDAWERQHCEESAQAAYFPRTAERGDWTMQLVTGDPEAGGSQTYVALHAAMAQAERRIWLTYGYFVPDEATIAALKDAAGRGVDVRLVLPGFSDFWAPALRRAVALRRPARRRRAHLRAPRRAAARQDRGHRRRLVERRLDQPRLAKLRPQLRGRRDRGRRGVRPRPGAAVRARPGRVHEITADAWARRGPADRGPRMACTPLGVLPVTRLVNRKSEETT